MIIHNNICLLETIESKQWKMLSIVFYVSGILQSCRSAILQSCRGLNKIESCAKIRQEKNVEIEVNIYDKRSNDATTP